MSNLKKIALVGLMFIFLFAQVFFIFVQSVRAADPNLAIEAAKLAKVGAPAGVPTVVTADVPGAISSMMDKFGNMLKTAVTLSALEAVSYMTRKVAYDSAVWLASGGKGQTPFIHNETFGDYITRTAQDAAMTGLDTLGASMGLDLCRIPDRRLDLLMRLGIGNVVGVSEPAPPDCSWASFRENWTMANFNSMYGAGHIEDRFNADFEVDQSDLGLYIAGTNIIEGMVRQAVYENEKQRMEDGGAKGFTDLISGNIKTPGETMMSEINANTPSAAKNRADNTILAATQAGAWEILPSTLSAFLNTLTSEMYTNWFTKGMFPFGLGWDEGSAGRGSADYASQDGWGGFTGRRLAQELFSEYKVANIRSTDNYMILSRFQAGCNTDNPAPDNCVMGPDLAASLQEKDLITIGEALKKGTLRGDLRLISPLRVPENEDPKCAETAYCYRNVQMLRKARILPLGFEIATALSPPDKPWTLEEVVNNYNECEPQKDGAGKIIGVIYDPVGHPYCHLIDPNWILKVPETKCNAMAFGPSLLGTGLPNRQEECVDFSSCVEYKDNKCVAYGYCTKEKNVSKFAVDTCESQYNSCKTFTSKTTKETSSYLYRTLDTGSCNAGNVGCRAYSLMQVDGIWQYPAVGSVDNPNGIIPAYINNGIFANANVTTNCSADSLGCTAFNPTDGVQPLYLRKAPDYLKCYDSTPSTAVLDWPLNERDLFSVTPKADCSKYAKPCIPEEVGCSWYSPVNSKGTVLGVERIPGKYTPGLVPDGDECAPKCVGYDAYREVASKYSVGQDLSYIIPKSGRECTAIEEGCSGFTNLSTTSGGLEQVDYYTFLRSCILPDKAKEKNFYTYAGSMVNGYELIVYNLEEDKTANGLSDPNNQTGGPKYFYKTDAELLENKRKCNEAVYRAGGSVDCKQFNDDQGKVYYRLLSQTIAVSEQCTPYRLNETALAPVVGMDEATCLADNVKGRWQDGVCEVCLQNGEFRSDDGRCYYYGLPTGVKLSSGLLESTTCSASANTCRMYKGSRANDLVVELFADFDSADADLVGWSAVANRGNVVSSPESTILGKRSLMYNATQPAGEVYRTDLSLIPGNSYEISFWAKGDVGTVAVDLVNNLTSVPANITSLGTVSVTNVWRNYKIGSDKILSGNTAPTTLSFKTSGTGRLFLDNVRLVGVNDIKYLVKNTLKVDTDCDSEPNDNNPGQALGCTEYKVKNGRTEESRYLTNFSYLCRDGAIGCVALLDTQNTLDNKQNTIYNLWIPAGRVGAIKNHLELSKDPCTVPAGASGCYTTSPITTSTPANLVANGGVFTTSTIYIPADTNPVTPIYLVNSDSEPMTCNPVSIGCTEAGAVVQAVNGVRFVTTTIQNNPAKYVSAGEAQDGILCQQESEGCDAFSGDVYFKDPKFTNAKICTYSSKAGASGSAYAGWFWKGVGKCAGGVNINKVCTVDADCPNSTCEGEEANTVPCYPDYIQGGNSYGLWSFGNKEKYDNFVGECAPEQNNCKEFIDHEDNNRAYYLIADSKMTQGDCDSGVSRKYGCILLDDTGQPNKFWNSRNTYSASMQAGYEKVPPVIGAPNDSNVIAKAVRDRECAEWVYSSQIHPNNEGVNKSYGLGVCNEAQSGTGFISQCAKDITSKWSGKGEFLNAEKYVRRPLSWNDVEYSGFSLFGSFQIADLTPVMIGSSYQLVHESIYPNENNRPVNAPVGITAGDCSAGLQDGTKPCGRDNNVPRDGELDGRCYNKKCVYPPQGIMGADQKLFEMAVGISEPKICRGYPEVDSPFPSSIIVNKKTPDAGLSYKSSFEGVNFCVDKVDNTGKSIGNDCDCNYQKITYGPYGEIKRYYDFTDTPLASIPSPYGGVDQVYTKSREASLEGWQGYCAQRDMRRKFNGTNDNTCLIWYPVDTPLGVADIGSRVETAGYNGINKTRYMCLANEPIKRIGYSEGAYQAANLGINWGMGAVSDNQYFNDFIDIDDPNQELYALKYELPFINRAYETVDGARRGGAFRINLTRIPTNYVIVGMGMDKDPWGGYIVENSPMSFLKEVDGLRHQEKYFRLRRPQIFDDGTLFGTFLYRNDIKQIDIFVDDDGQLAANAPEIIVMYPNGLVEPDGGIGYGGGVMNGGRVTIGETDLTDYLQFQTAEAASFEKGSSLSIDSPPSGESWELLLGTNLRVNGTAYGFRVVFGKDGKLLGVLADHHVNNEHSSHLGFMVGLHLNNGVCKTVAQISKADDATGKIASKTSAFSLYWNDVIGRVGVPDAQNNPDTFVLRRKKFDDASQQLDNKPYGLVGDSWDYKIPNLKVNPFSVQGALNARLSDDYYKNVLMTHTPSYDGGIPLTLYGSLNLSNSYNINCAGATPLALVVTENNTYCGMLQKMFGKVYNIFDLQTDGDNKGKYMGRLLTGGGDNPSNVNAMPLVADAASPLSTMYSHYVPKIASVNMWDCKKPGKAGCGLGALDKFTVGNTDNADVYINGQDSTSIKFFAWASFIQMPLTRIKVDFDNGTSAFVSDNGKQGNYKPYCDTGLKCKYDPNVPCKKALDCKDGATPAGRVCEAEDASVKGYGNTSETGCVDKYYEVFGQYACDARALYNDVGERFVWNKEAAGNNIYGAGGHLAVMRTTLTYNGRVRVNPEEILLTPDAQAQGLSDGSVVCVYEPKVQVLDNWGWCSGRCTHGAYNGSILPKVNSTENGCYSELPTDARLSPIKNQCDDLIDYPNQLIKNFIPFGGQNDTKRVIVIPSI